MTLDDLKIKMAALGFKWDTNSIWGVGIFYKQVTTKRPSLSSNCNQLVIDVFDNHEIPNWRGENRYSLAANITGETSLGWMKCEIYNRTPEQFLATHAEIEAALIQAWEAPVDHT